MLGSLEVDKESRKGVDSNLASLDHHIIEPLHYMNKINIILVSHNTSQNQELRSLVPSLEILLSANSTLDVNETLNSQNA